MGAFEELVVRDCAASVDGAKFLSLSVLVFDCCALLLQIRATDSE